MQPYISASEPAVSKLTERDPHQPAQLQSDTDLQPCSMEGAEAVHTAYLLTASATPPGCCGLLPACCGPELCSQRLYVCVHVTSFGAQNEVWDSL